MFKTKTITLDFKSENRPPTEADFTYKIGPDAIEIADTGRGRALGDRGLGSGDAEALVLAHGFARVGSRLVAETRMAPGTRLSGTAGTASSALRMELLPKGKSGIRCARRNTERVYKSSAGAYFQSPTGLKDRCLLNISF
jgi:hypothetical protein